MAHPSTSPESWHLTLAGLQRIKRWHLDHQSSHPLEHQLWDAVLTLWVMGWAGWLPAFALDIPLAYPLCLFGMLVPQLYVRWRVHAHTHGRLRCDWLELAH